jgi:hypothetical protein
MTSSGRLSGPGAFSRGRPLASHCVVCTSEDLVKGELFLMGFGAIVCVCVRVLGVLPWWGGDLVRRGARVFFFKVGLECGEYGVRICCDFVRYGVPDCL